MGRNTLLRVRQGHAKPRACGFTLIELLFVVVIIGLLAAVVAPRHFGEVGKSNARIAKAQITALDQSLKATKLRGGQSS